MKIYCNQKTGEVRLDGKILDPKPSQKLANHSPNGFMWGYGGSGPAQLALAILLRKLPKEKALTKYQDFKWQVIAKLPQKSITAEVDFDSWNAGGDPKIKIQSLSEDKTQEKSRPVCTKGHESQCINADPKGDCDCACGGANHGKNEGVTIL